MITIKEIAVSDYEAVFGMMKVFYASGAVLTGGSEEIFKRDIETCLKGSPYLEGYVFCKNAEIIGYGMLAKSFSTEFGKPCVWIEDLYIKPEHRGLGAGKRFMEFVEDKYKNCLLRLEVEKGNLKAVKLYEKCGFKNFPYSEMKKLLALFILFITASSGFCATTSYDKYGIKTGSYNKSGSTVTQYDRYGTKTGSFKETSSGYNSYDKYGTKTGSYKIQGNTITQYDKYGTKTGTYKTDSNGVTTSYDKYGRKTGSFKKDSSGRIIEYDQYGSKAGSYK